MGPDLIPGRDATCAVIVAYNPGPGFEGRCQAALALASRLVVIDNASHPIVGVPSVGGIILVRNERNVGLGAALEQAFDLARGFDWVLVLDDDSTPLPHLMDTYAEVVRHHPDPARIGLIGCNHWDRDRKRPGIHPYNGGRRRQATPAILASGSLVRRAAYEAAGAFRADYFIDWIDYEHAVRIQRAGFDTVRTGEVLIEHALGHPVVHRFPRRVLCNHHSVARTYYWMRNRNATLRTASAGERRVLRKADGGLRRFWTHLILHDPPRLAHARAAWLGWWHARQGRFGLAPSTLGVARPRASNDDGAR